MFKLKIPFFKPLWIRIVTVLVCFSWAVFEFANGESFWAMIFGAMGAYAAHQFFIDWSDPEDIQNP